MRLAFLSSTKQWSGVKTWTLESAAVLAARGHEAVLFCKAGSAFARRASSFKLKADDPGKDRMAPAAIGFYKKAFAEKGVDAVFLHSGQDLRTAGVAARLLGLPVMLYVEQPELLANTLPSRMLFRYVRPHCIASTSHARERVHAAIPFLSSDDSCVIHPAKAPLREPSRSLSRPLRIVSTNRVHPFKGHVELAHTLARLKREGHVFEWHIAGIGEAMDGLRMECSRLGIANQVRFYGFLHDVRHLLLECDVFVMSSYAMGQGSSLLEAMACSLVPVARDVDGVAEYWPEKLSPLLAKAAQAPAPAAYNAMANEDFPLYAPLKTVFTAEPKELIAMKYHAWRHLAVNFSLGSRAVELETLVRSFVGGGGTPRAHIAGNVVTT